MARKIYEITSRNETIDSFTVRVNGFEHAACIAARRLYGRKTGLFAQRVTGDSCNSGYFQAYTPCRTGGSTSCGRNFYIREL